MQPHMSDPEYRLFLSFLKNSSKYLEFGSGGSTYAASKLVKNSIISLDSSKDWLEKVRQACAGEESKVKPTLLYVDIGPTGDWGRPTDPATRNRWPSYYESIWEQPNSFDTDLYLVDGRFRVACFMQILINCRPDSLIMIHDFTSRANYHVIRTVAREIANSEDFSVFAPLLGGSRRQVHDILRQHRFQVE